jgi:hypothetical protein
MSKPKLLVTATLVLSALLGAGAAQAQPDVQWAVTIGSSGSVPVVQQPVVVQRPVVVSQPVVVPRPVVMQQPVVVEQRVYERPGYAWHRPWQGYYRQPTRWDHDGDGIPDRRDPVYNPRWDRDGDGIPNRHDPVYNPQWDRNGNGIADRHERRGRY